MHIGVDILRHIDILGVLTFCYQSNDCIVARLKGNLFLSYPLLCYYVEVVLYHLYLERWYKLMIFSLSLTHRMLLKNYIIISHKASSCETFGL